MSQTYHLIRRNGVYHYRRRVPLELVTVIGKKEVQLSLDTTSLAVAKKRRALEDLKWSERFEAAQLSSKASLHQTQPAPPARPLSEEEVIRLVQDYVEKTDARSKATLLNSPPESAQQKAEMAQDIEYELDILRNPDDPRGNEWIYAYGEKILKRVGRTIADPGIAHTVFAQWVRRALVEHDRRRLARIQEDHGRTLFDQAFDPARPRSATFGEIADQFLRMTEEEAHANHTSEKWVDKQRANVVLLREIVGEHSIQEVDFDACLRVRSILARIPANRNKLYPGISIEKVLELGEADERATLSPVTQAQYLQTLNAILDLALKKRLITVNPGTAMKPLKRDTVTPSAKRLPFTSDQLKLFFESTYYRQASQHAPPFMHDQEGWRFWLPLLCLFMGLRPNEACQMFAEDVRRTDAGTWYVDVVASNDEDEDATKSLKTGSSRRKIPIHPELSAIGFIKYAEQRGEAGNKARLFPALQPDNYGNHAKYALKRFRETYLPQAITLQPRQSFYSLRHNFRDALRAIGAPPDALQALGGWSQGQLVSDSYGWKSNPDYQFQFMKQVAFPGVSLAHLRPAL